MARLLPSRSSGARLPVASPATHSTRIPVRTSKDDRASSRRTRPATWDDLVSSTYVLRSIRYFSWLAPFPNSKHTKNASASTAMTLIICRYRDMIAHKCGLPAHPTIAQTPAEICVTISEGGFVSFPSWTNLKFKIPIWFANSQPRFAAGPWDAV